MSTACVALCSIGTCVLMEGTALCAAATDRPNVLLILTDDQGYGDFSLHGNPHLQTPRIDELGRRSVRFDRFFVNSFCAPTRAALLTGRWPLRTGTHGVTHNREVLRDSEVTLAEALQAARYRTGCFGKWHNGDHHPYTPMAQGFSEFFGFCGGHFNDYFDPRLQHGQQFESTSGYITDVLTNAAIDFVEQPGEQPFFCYLAYNAPHSPYQVPDAYYDPFVARGFDERTSAFFGMCACVDANVGRLLDRLESAGRAQNTIVVFTTDNGGTQGVKHFNAGMRGGKSSVHEGGSRVPLFVHWPAANWEPRVVEPIAAHVDLYPTLLDLCGVPPPPGPPVDGQSLRPLLESASAGWPERVLFTHNPIDERNRYPGAVRTAQYRLVREILGKGGGSAAINADASATAWQLYDLQADPGQKVNRAAELPGVVAELSQQYEAWLDDISRERVRRLPIGVGYDEQPAVELHAPQAYFTDPLHFQAGPGYAHDWLTGWTDVAGRLWFELDVQHAGNYRVELACTCRLEDAGARVRIRTVESELTVDVPAATLVELPLEHRDALGHERYQCRAWPHVAAGVLTLPAGAVTLYVEALAKTGEQLIDFKHLRLIRE